MYKVTLPESFFSKKLQLFIPDTFKIDYQQASKTAFSICPFTRIR